MLEVVRMREELDRRAAGRKLHSFFPDRGEFPRAAYPKHLEFFRWGKTARERLFLAANRVGKTIAGGYELTCHLTGRYPAWWEGRRFNGPIIAWCAGDTLKTVKDILQLKMLGKPGEFGTGLIPREDIVKTTPGLIPEAVGSVHVRHQNGGNSILEFKSFDQGREAFQGTEIHVGWLDEEAPQNIYSETITRTATTGGMLMLTFTPLMGLTDLVQSFLADGQVPDRPNPLRPVINAGWDDVPHLTEEAKVQLLGAYLPHERDARSKGLPMLGSGKIYPIPEDLVVVPPFQVPGHYLRSYGLDVGWNMTAAMFGAYNKDSDVLYIVDEHWGGEQKPPVHAAGIRARGDIPGTIDPASRGRSQQDGRKLLDEYRELGLDIIEADNAVNAGIHACLTRMLTGRLKVFSNCPYWLKEFRLYARDEKGKIVKKNDHAMDAMRYLVMTGLGIGKPALSPKPKPDPLLSLSSGGGGAWMG